MHYTIDRIIHSGSIPRLISYLSPLTLLVPIIRSNTPADAITLFASGKAENSSQNRSCWRTDGGTDDET